MPKQWIRYDTLFFLVLFCLTELIIWPIGDFPLNDDWAYASTLRNYLQNGHYQPSFWQGFPGLTQFFSALFFVKVFGFSFHMLRLCTIFHLLWSAFVFEKILDDLKIQGIKKQAALFLFLFNPLSLYLANTYMSDVYQMPYALLAVLAIIRYLRENKQKYIWLVAFFSCLAVINRQSALFLPLFFALITTFNQAQKPYHRLMVWLPLILNITALSLFQNYVNRQGLSIPNYVSISSLLNQGVNFNMVNLKRMAFYLLNACLSLALLLIPITAKSFKSYCQNLKPRQLVMAALLVFLCGVKIYFSGKYLPFTGNVFYAKGIGPVIMPGFNSDANIALSLTLKLFWSLMHLPAILSILVIIEVFYSVKQSDKQRNNLVMMLAFAGVYLFFYCINFCNDRYLWFLLPLMITLTLLHYPNKIHRVVFLIPATTILLLSVVALHDYFSFNRNKWEAVSVLTNTQHVSPSQIDGGFEVNAWFLAPNNFYLPQHEAHWWWVEGNNWMLSTKPESGYQTVTTYNTGVWLSQHLDTLMILKKNH